MNGFDYRGTCSEPELPGKLLAADCHGPIALAELTKDGAPIIRGLEVTAFTNAEEAQAGATDWVKGNSFFMQDEFTELGATFKEASAAAPGASPGGRRE